MAYIKTTWQNGDIITAEKLNHIETGIESVESGGGSGESFVVIVNLDSDGTATSDTEWENIVEAYNAGKTIWLKIVYTYIEHGTVFKEYYENIATVTTIVDNQGSSVLDGIMSAVCRSMSDNDEEIYNIQFIQAGVNSTQVYARLGHKTFSE